MQWPHGGSPHWRQHQDSDNNQFQYRNHQLLLVFPITYSQSPIPYSQLPKLKNATNPIENCQIGLIKINSIKRVFMK